MDHNFSHLLEIGGALLLALYLLRRIILTLIYCALLCKASARAIKRRLRRAKIYWRHGRDRNPHGFALRWIESIARILFAPALLLKPAGSLLLHIYIVLERWAMYRLAPFLYRHMPRRIRLFCDWVLDGVHHFTQKQVLRRRRHYAALSYARWQKRMESGENRAAQCPMRALLPLPPMESAPLRRR